MTGINPNPTPFDPATPDTRTERPARAWWGIGASLVLVAGVAFYAHSLQTAFEQRVAALEARASDRLAAEIEQLRSETSRQSTTASAASEQLSRELDEARQATEELQQAHRRTVRTAAANGEAVKAARQDASKQVAAVEDKVTTVSAEVKSVATTLAATQTTAADDRRDIRAATAALSKQVATHDSLLAEVRRRGERTIVEFDIRKSSSPETWTVADIRIELRKADVRHAKYDVVLHVDDGRVERKDLVVNEPVPFLVGRQKIRYELVVTAVERDRIRGYVTMPKDPGLAAERPTAGI